MKIWEHFRLKDEKEDFQTVYDTIDKGVVFRGTNLWVLVFAIFMASLGLNVNSPAVIIGAMLISPLMGPIMGLGLGMGASDLPLLKKSLYNYFFATAVSLATSTLYFLLTPINGVESEMLARTSPTVYDVLIALFGGLAGMLAISSKQKGNVIPGVAIATALMPPLCTAGYGLATLNPEFFFGAFYLFFINTVFIAFATFLVVRFAKFPITHLANKKEDRIANRIFFLVILATLFPSIYFAYDLVKQTSFLKRANTFINSEAIFPNNYLLKKTIDAKHQTITLTYGGQAIEKKEIDSLKSYLPKYQLDTGALVIRQGFSYLNSKEHKDDKESNLLKMALAEKDNQLMALQAKSDSLQSQKKLGDQICQELKVQYPSIESCILHQVLSDSSQAHKTEWMLIVKSKTTIDKKEKIKIADWLKIRISTNDLIIYYKD